MRGLRCIRSSIRSACRDTCAWLFQTRLAPSSQTGTMRPRSHRAMGKEQRSWSACSTCDGIRTRPRWRTKRQHGLDIQSMLPAGGYPMSCTCCKHTTFSWVYPAHDVITVPSCARIQIPSKVLASDGHVQHSVHTKIASVIEAKRNHTVMDKKSVAPVSIPRITRATSPKTFLAWLFRGGSRVPL